MKKIKILQCIIEFLIGIGVYVISIYALLKANMPIYPETMPPDILQTIWDEIANITTIAPMLCLFATNYIANKINPNISGHIRILWNTIGVVMLLFYRVFIALGLHPVLLAGEGIVHFILCFAILCYQGIGREEINYKGSKKY